MVILTLPTSITLGKITKSYRQTNLVSHALLPVLDDIELDTLALGDGDPGLFTFADDHDVLETGSELVSLGIGQMDNLEGTGVLLTVLHDTDTTDIVSSGGHAHVTVLKLGEVLDFSGVDVETDGIESLDVRVGETDGAAIMGDAVGGAFGSLSDLLHAAQFVTGFILGDLVDNEASLGIVHETKVLLGLLEGHDIHQPGRVGVLGLDLSVNLDETLDQDHLGLSEVQSVFETVTEKDDERKALTGLVRSGAGLGSPDTTELVKHPGRGRGHALLMLPSTTSHD